MDKQTILEFMIELREVNTNGTPQETVLKSLNLDNIMRGNLQRFHGATQVLATNQTTVDDGPDRDPP
jgi:hypothetical protein